MLDQPEPRDIFRTMLEYIERGELAAVITVVHATGSTPRKAGTRALLLSDGSLVGTVGGGLLESQARRAALETARTGIAQLFDFRFNGPSAAEPFPVCGGAVRVLVDPTPERHKAALRLAARGAVHREPMLLVTRLEHGERLWVGIRVLTPRSPIGLDEVPLELFHDVLREGVPCLHHVRAGVEALLEPIRNVPVLIVVGGGHVGQALVRQATLAGFWVIVVEDRPEYTQAALFPEGTMVVTGDVGEQLSRITICRDTYVAIVSRGHLTDSRALAAVLHSDAAYIGMMGSRRKIALIRKEFLDSGKCTPEQFDRVHAPIGLDIGAETVPEIAASITAQLIAARRGKLNPK